MSYLYVIVWWVKYILNLKIIKKEVSEIEDDQIIFILLNQMAFEIILAMKNENWKF